MEEQLHGEAPAPVTQNKSPRHYKKVTGLLLAVNAVVIILVVLLCVWQSIADYQRRKRDAEKSFMAAVESFSLFADGDMKHQQVMISNWARYIEYDGLDLQETLTFLSNIVTSTDYTIHLISAETLRGWSAGRQNAGSLTDDAGQPAVSAGRPARYGVPVWPGVDYQPEASAFSLVLSAMSSSGEADGDVFLTAPFSNPETGAESLAFCFPVSLRDSSGSGSSRYIVLKIIGKDELGVGWKVSDTYRRADIALLDRYGDYILRGRSFLADNFWDFILANNDVSYYGIGIMQAEFEHPKPSLLELKDAAGRPCYYVGCALSGVEKRIVVAGIRCEEVIGSTANYRLALIVLFGMLVLFISDGFYLISINRRLRESVERAEQESRFKTDFLSSMSHDIRTPMNAILGLTKIMKRHLGNPEKLEENLGKIETSGRHLLMLINDVLDISKIESEGVVLNPASFSLAKIVEEIQTLTEAQCREKALTVNITVKDIKHDMLVADELRVKQVFMNLLSNAIKYTPRGGSVDVTLSEVDSPLTQVKLSQSVQHLLDTEGGDFSGSNREIQESFHADSCIIRYVVRDTGIGMSREFMKTMYNAFTREVDTRVNKTPGTGLGLAIVKQLVDLMGGTISCESEVGKGTCFTVDLDLPIAYGEQHRAGDDDGQEDESFEGKLVLIAEDNDINWEIENELLSYQGIKCERAENGRICVDKLCAAPAGSYIAILMDMQMPEMDGLEATKVIRALEDPNRRNIPIIAVTANAFVDDVKNCLLAGMDAHVCKPVSVDSVMKALRQVARRK